MNTAYTSFCVPFTKSSGVSSIKHGNSMSLLGALSPSFQNTNGLLLSSNNLSDVANQATARNNLGLGSSNSPAFSTVVAANITGGSSTNSTLTLKSTSASGVTGSDIVFQVGNNGATEAMRILNSGSIGIGGNNPITPLHVFRSAAGGIADVITVANPSTYNNTAARIVFNLSTLNSTYNAYIAATRTNYPTITATNLGLFTNDGFGNIEALRLTERGGIQLPSTITATGTTGAQTINKSAGRVNIAAGGTSVVVTNSIVSSTSIILAVAATNDSTARVTSVVPANGSFTINTVACTAETAFNFLVLA